MDRADSPGRLGTASDMPSPFGYAREQTLHGVAEFQREAASVISELGEIMINRRIIKCGAPPGIGQILARETNKHLIIDVVTDIQAVSYTHLTLPTIA